MGDDLSYYFYLNFLNKNATIDFDFLHLNYLVFSVSFILHSDIDYLRLSLASIIEASNPGNLAAFQDSNRNREGMLFEKDDFIAAMEEKNIYINPSGYPEEFMVMLKYSPISLFKKWIMILSNQVLLKTKEKHTRPFRREFFFYKQDKDNYYFYPLATNATHERFLLTVYEKPVIVDQHFNFKTFFNEEKKLVLYKNYHKRKVASLFFDKKAIIIPGQLYAVSVHVNKTPYRINYRVTVQHVKSDISYEIWLHKDKAGILRKEERDKILLDQQQSEGESKNVKEKSTHQKAELTSNLGADDNKHIDDKNKKFKLQKRDSKPAPAKGNNVSAEQLQIYRNDVIALINRFSKEVHRTNKFGNISLGRIFKTPILINLSSRYKNAYINIDYNDATSIVSIKDKEGKVLKSFKLSIDPKSNWLESKY